MTEEASKGGPWPHKKINRHEKAMKKNHKSKEKQTMKTIQYAAVAVMIMSLVAGVPAYAADDVSEAISQHETLAAQYEAKAVEQDALIAEHVPMNKKYEERFWMIKKAGKPKNVLDMDKHCTGIVQNATGLRNELLEFAKWHRMRAAELHGQ
jgi:hypothetical protein